MMKILVARQFSSWCFEICDKTPRLCFLRSSLFGLDAVALGRWPMTSLQAGSGWVSVESVDNTKEACWVLVQMTFFGLYKNGIGQLQRSLSHPSSKRKAGSVVPMEVYVGVGGSHWLKVSEDGSWTTWKCFWFVFWFFCFSPPNLLVLVPLS